MTSQVASTKYSLTLGDGHIGPYELPQRTSLSGPQQVGPVEARLGPNKTAAKAKHANLDMSHMPTGAEYADQALQDAHNAAMAAPKVQGSPTRQMPPHGGRKASTGRRIY